MWLTFCQPLNEMGWRWKQVQCHLLPVDHEISYGASETGTSNELSLTACQPCDDLEKISNNVTYSLLTMRQAPWQRAECHSHPVELWKDYDDMPNNTAATHCLFVMGWDVIELPLRMTCDSVTAYLLGQELIRPSLRNIQYYLHPIIWGKAAQVWMCSTLTNCLSKISVIETYEDCNITCPLLFMVSDLFAGRLLDYHSHQLHCAYEMISNYHKWNQMHHTSCSWLCLL